MRSACLQTDIHRANATTRSQYATCRPKNCYRARACPVTTAQTAKLPNTMPSESTLSVRFRSLIQRCDAVAHEQHHGTFAATCIPPTFESVSLGPRVEHLSAAKNSTLLQCIGQQLMLPECFVHELICFGAVHWCPVPPALAPSRAAQMDPEHVAELTAQREAAVSRHGRQAVHSQPQRATQDVAVEQHAYVRVHVHPKRFPAVYAVDWKECVVYDGEGYVVVHKPAGVQVAPTVDNVLENVLFCTAQALESAEPLLITHRLDTCTEGLLFMARNKPLVQHFNQLLQQPGAVRKFYKTLTQHPPPVGRLVHHMTQEQIPGQPAHSKVHNSPVPGSHCCSLDVVDVQPVSSPPEVAASWGATAYESLLELQTGRTHQIRVQLAAEGCPLYGDTMYADSAFRDSSAARRQEPLGAIGLQACKLVVAQSDNIQARTFEAKTLWWSDSHP